MMHRPFLVLSCALTLAIACAAARANDCEALVLYPAYGDARGGGLDGRVTELRQLSKARAQDSGVTNLWRNLRRFFNEETQGCAVLVTWGGEEYRALSDAEGYFHIDLAGVDLAAGWHPIGARSMDAQAQGSLLIVPTENTLGIISDLDDTILVSEVTEKKKLLANTFLKNPMQRLAVPGTAAFYHGLAAQNPQPQSAPMFYFSASPRQLAEGIQAFLDHNGFPHGVLITKKVTNDMTSDPLTDQFAYKTKKIGEIFTRLPWVSFVLVGDDGERDPEIYAAVQARFPQQVRAIYIRKAHPDPHRPRLPGQQDLSVALKSLQQQ